MLLIGYYTKGTPYEADAERLRRSCEAVNVPYRLLAVPPTADWDEATALKPLVIRHFRERVAGGLLYCDVDAVVHENCCAYFDGLEGTATFAVHWFQGPGCGGREQGNMAEHLLSGTMWFADTLEARFLLDAWIARNDEKRIGGGQTNLAEVIAEGAVSANLVCRIPGRYCWVFHKPEAYPPGEYPVIEHLMASRENRGLSKGTLDPLRQLRLAALEVEYAN